MKWFRSNVKHGSRVALFALAVQFALSFGHFHGLDAQAAPASGLSIQQQQPASDHDSDRHPDICSICVVMAMANATLFATPPVLPPPLAAQFCHPIAVAEFGNVNSVCDAFQPRAPPIS